MFTACILQSLCCHNFSFFFNILSILFQVIALSVVGLVVVVVAMVIMIRTLGTMILHQVGNWNFSSSLQLIYTKQKQNINIQSSNCSPTDRNITKAETGAGATWLSSSVIFRPKILYIYLFVQTCSSFQIVADNVVCDRNKYLFQNLFLVI